MAQATNHSWEKIRASVLRTAVTRFMTNLIDLTVSEGSNLDAEYIGRAAKTMALKVAVSAGLPPEAVLSESDIDKIEDWAAFNREFKTAITVMRTNIEDRQSGLIETEVITQDNNRLTVRVMDAFMRANERDPILTPAEMQAAIQTALMMTSEETNQTIAGLSGILSGAQNRGLSEGFKSQSLTSADIRAKIGIPQDDKAFEQLLLTKVLEVVETQQLGARKSPLKAALQSLAH